MPNTPHALAAPKRSMVDPGSAFTFFTFLSCRSDARTDQVSMFKLRKEHLDAFEAQATNLFANRVIAHVKSVWPEETQELGDANLRSMIQTGIQRAGALGLAVEYDVVRFVDLSFLLAADFETNPLSIWTRPLIADRNPSPTAKVDRIYQRMNDEFTLIEKRRAPKP